MKWQEEKIRITTPFSYLIFEVIYKKIETSAEMHRNLKGLLFHRPVSHFHRQIDVFDRVSVTEQRRDIDLLFMDQFQGFLK